MSNGIELPWGLVIRKVSNGYILEPMGRVVSSEDRGGYLGMKVFASTSDLLEEIKKQLEGISDD